MVVAFAVVVGAVLWWVFNRTRAGRLVLAVIHDSDVSPAMGINVPRVYVAAFTGGAVLAALGGALTAPMTSVVPGISVEVIVLAFAVVVIGGLGSLGGAALGALIVGMARSASVHLAPQVELFVIYAVMALVLIFRPQGLFGRAEVRRI
jgi:branched-chain amino acid transport system permease protein